MEEIRCCDDMGLWCCNCRINCCPGSAGGNIKSRLLNNHAYCYDCYPKMVDLYIAEQKLKAFEKESGV